MCRRGTGSGACFYGWSRDSSVTSGQKGNSVLGVRRLPPACHFSLGRIVNLKLKIWLRVLRLLRAHRTEVTVAWQLGKSRLAETSSAGSSPVDPGLPLDPLLSSGPSLTCYFAVKVLDMLLCWSVLSSFCVFFWDPCLCNAPRGRQYGCVLSDSFSGFDPVCSVTSADYSLEKGTHISHIGSSQ